MTLENGHSQASSPLRPGVSSTGRPVFSSDAAKEAQSEVGFQDRVSSGPARQPHSKFQDLTVYQSAPSLSHEETGIQPSSTCSRKCCVVFSVLSALWLRELTRGLSQKCSSTQIVV